MAHRAALSLYPSARSQLTLQDGVIVHRVVYVPVYSPQLSPVLIAHIYGGMARLS